jgi:hypothetical protein
VAVNAKRLACGLLAGSLLAAWTLVPAFGAAAAPGQPRRQVSAPARGLGSFTPSSADPRLAALFARGGLEARGFRFTPAEAKGTSRVTVAVRARSTRTEERVAAVPATVGVAPIAYNLGVSVGWRRFAIAGDVAKVDLGGQPGGREAVDLGVSYSLPRFSGRVKAGADRATPDAPQLVQDQRSYSLDVGGSYSLTRNLDVTAGVRYRSDRERMMRLDDRRDSQAVYVGTAFRF